MAGRGATGTLRTIDLFAGAGGLSLGFDAARTDKLWFEPVFAVEYDPAAAATYKANFGDVDVFDGDIAKLRLEDVPEAEVVIGGPPCQGFSRLGRDLDDKRRAKLNSLWRRYIDVVRHVEPEVFVIENVPQFARSPQFRLLQHKLNLDPVLSQYHVDYQVLNAAHYGVPQFRKRGFLVASKQPLRWPPAPTHFADDSLELGLAYQTVRDAIADLPPEPTTEGPSVLANGMQDLHIRRRPTELSMRRYRAVPPGGNRFDLPKELLPNCWKNKPTGTTDGMGRMWWDRPAPTIRTEFYKPEKGRYLHPVEHRAITHREAARLQTFPDAFVFEGTKIEIARQIGNAVPPDLARAIGRTLISGLTGETEHG